MDLGVQPKLLHLLQEGTFSRLGGDLEVSVDVRVIVTSKNHLEPSMAEERFREDLFSKINVINLTLPPLRERLEQVVSFARYFFERYRKIYRKGVSPLSPEILRAFQAYSWPGNIRELENFVKRVVFLGDETSLLQTLYEKIEVQKQGQGKKGGSFHQPSAPRSLFNLKEVGKRAAEQGERELIEATLQQTCWNRKEAAKLLRTSYKALHYKIKKYSLNGGMIHREYEVE